MGVVGNGGSLVDHVGHFAALHGAALRFFLRKKNFVILCNFFGQQLKQLQHDRREGIAYVDRISAHRAGWLIVYPTIDAFLMKLVLARQFSNVRPTQRLEANAAEFRAVARFTGKRDFHIYLRFEAQHEENPTNKFSAKQIPFVCQFSAQIFDLCCQTCYVCLLFRDVCWK